LGQAVQTFHMTGSDYAEAADAGVGAEGGDFFVDGHAVKEIVETLLNGEIGILKWERLGWF
jgi:hypothetical protein